MDETFKIYEKNIKSSLLELEHFLTLSFDEQTEETIAKAERTVNQVENVLEELQNETFSGNQAEEKIKYFTSQLNKQKKKIQQISEKFYEELGRSELVNKQNSNLLEGEMEANRQLGNLERAKRQVIGLEETGNHIVREMKNQSNQMNRVNDNIDSVDKEIGIGRALVDKMMARENRNKALVYLAMCVLLFFILVSTFL